MVVERNIYSWTCLMQIKVFFKQRQIFLSHQENSCWINELSNFHLGQFAKVDVDINVKNSKRNSRSNETTQNVIALIVFF